MEMFCGSVVLAHDVPRTGQELIELAIDARTYSADADENTRLKAAAKQRWQGTQADAMVAPKDDIYMIDGYKGIDMAGRAIAASWAEADFTVEPGGGRLLQATSIHEFASGYHANAVDFGRRVFWATANDTVIYFDVTKR